MKNKLDDIHDRIARACDNARRDAAGVTLIAVTKNASDDQLKQALDLGLRQFGENRVQDAQARWDGLKSSDITLHLIGPLQSNKVKQAADLFDVLHTLDRASLAEEMVKLNWMPPCFVQVNTGEEEQKSGLAPQDLGGFMAACPISVQGLMCIPPVDAPASLHFALLKTLAARHGLSQLSMGMTGDFDAAIRCGATHIRVGSALFAD